MFLAWILHSKVTQCGILLQIYREHGNRATLLRHHPRQPCVPIKMAIAGSSNSSWRPLLRSQKEKSSAREHFSVRKIYFWRLKEHFGRYFLKEWRFPLNLERLQKRAMSIICPGHSCHKSLNIKNFKELATHRDEICETLFDTIGDDNNHRLYKLLPAPHEQRR